MLVGATVTAVVVLAAWFPASDLLHQHDQLAAATTQLHQLDQQDQSLRKKAAELKTPADVERIAEQQYDLVAPGAQAYQVLPPSGSGDGTVGGSTGTTTSGAADTSTSRAGASQTARTGASATGTVATTSGGFVSRVLQTLEFWR